MRNRNILAHVTWECKYHVWILRYCGKRFYGKVRKRCREIIRELCSQKDELPEELSTTKKRLAKIKEAKKILEEKA